MAEMKLVENQAEICEKGAGIGTSQQGSKQDQKRKRKPSDSIKGRKGVLQKKRKSSGSSKVLIACDTSCNIRVSYSTRVMIM